MGKGAPLEPPANADLFPMKRAQYVTGGASLQLGAVLERNLGLGAETTKEKLTSR